MTILSNNDIQIIEQKLNTVADNYHATSNKASKELNRGYAQGMAFVLASIGYDVHWDNGKATIDKY